MLFTSIVQCYATIAVDKMKLKKQRTNHTINFACAESGVTRFWGSSSAVLRRIHPVWTLLE